MVITSQVLTLSGWLFPWAMAHGPWSSGYGPGMMGWGIGGFFGPIVMVLFWILIVMSVVYFVRYAFDVKRGDRQESALDITRKRYARGEISKEEFERLKEDLTKL